MDDFSRGSSEPHGSTERFSVPAGPMARMDRGTSALIISDIRLYQEGLSYALKSREYPRVVGTAATREEALAQIRENLPDIVLLDMAMPASLETVRAILAVAPDARIVAFTVSDGDQDVLACAEAGVIGYVPRSGSMEDLLAVVRSAVRGELLCSPRIAASLFRRLARSTREQSPETSSTVTRLTSREGEIVRLLDQGLSNKEIAQQLRIEVATVKNHVHNVLEKLQVSSRGEAAARLRGYPPVRRLAHQDETV